MSTTETAPAAPKTDPITSQPVTPAAAPAGEGKLYAGKYRSVEELEKGYTEAQAALSSKRPTIEIADDATIETVLAAAKLTEADLRKEFTTNGKISDAQYKALREVNPGISRKMVEQNLAAVTTAEALAFETAVGIAGGEEQFNSLLAFAKALPDEKRAEVEAGLKSFGTYKQTVTALKAAYEAEHGKPNPEQVYAGASASSPGGFTNHGEFAAAQRKATKESGHWRNDQVFMARLAKTSPEIINAI
jgi:hypothetical protein